MQADFWHERWQKSEISFHQADINEWLIKHWPALDVPAHGQVLVPLCGKSLDMRWLAGQGHRVFGVELSELACRAFFADAGIQCSVSSNGRFTIFAGGSYELWCGDVFALTATDVRDVVAVYDRAALVALPPQMRQQYAQCLTQRLPRHVALLQLTFDYDQAAMAGPPHAVPVAEVRELYGATFAMEVLLETPHAEPPPPLKARGLTWLSEAVLKLTRGEVRARRPIFIHYVHDMGRARRFYDAVFGVTASFASAGWTTLDFGSFELALHILVPGHTDEAVLAHAGLNLEVDSIEVIGALIAANGGAVARVREATSNVPDRVATCRDSEGNGFELRQHVGFAHQGVDPAAG